MAKISPAKKSVLLILGVVLIIIGITSVLVWWEHVISLFRGAFGMCLAIGGLLVLYTIKD